MIALGRDHTNMKEALEEIMKAPRSLNSGPLLQRTAVQALQNLNVLKS